MMRLVRLAAEQVVSGIDLKRVPYQVSEFERVPSGSSAMVRERDADWSLVDLLRALYQLSSSDSLKSEVYVGCANELRGILEHGTWLEQEYAAQLLMQLCFDPSVAESVANDTPLCDLIASIGNAEYAAERERLVAHASGIQWLVEQHRNAANPTTMLQSRSTANNVSGGHIMISYNSASRGNTVFEN